jgi:hypothetical protein
MAAGDAFEFRVEFGQFIRRVVNGTGPALVTIMGRALVNIARAFEKKIRLGRLRGGTTDDRLGVRTGALSQSFGTAVAGLGTPNVVVHVGFGPPAHPWAGAAKKYAPVHEGLVPMPIRPKVGKFLAIPVADNLTGAGVARIKSPRDLADPDFVPHIFASGLGYLVFEGRRLMFLLLRYVTIRPRLHFADEWRLFLPTARQQMRAVLARATAQANTGTIPRLPPLTQGGA